MEKLFKILLGFISFLIWLSVLALFIVNLLYLHYKNEYFDQYQLYYLLILVFYPLLPFISELNIGGLGIKMLRDQMRKTREIQYNSEVIRDGNNNLYYCKDQTLYLLPDEDTAKFLSTSKGIINLGNNDGILKEYTKADEKFESVKDAKMVITEKEKGCPEPLFMVFHDKWKGYIGSWSTIIDLQLEEKYSQKETINYDKLRKLITIK